MESFCFVRFVFLSLLAINKCDIIDIGLASGGEKKISDKPLNNRNFKCKPGFRMVTTIISFPYGDKEPYSNIILNENHHIVVTSVTNQNEINGELFEYNSKYNNQSKKKVHFGSRGGRYTIKNGRKRYIK